MPDNCSADVQAAVAYADDILTNASADEVPLLRRAVFIANSANPNGNAAIGAPEDLSDWNIASILAYPFQRSFFSFQSYGYAIALSTFCHQLETWTPFNTSSFTLTSPPSIITNNTNNSPPSAVGIAATHGPQPAFYALLYALLQKGHADSTAPPHHPRAAGDAAAWLWQLCSEFGEFQVSSPHNPYNLVSRFYDLSGTAAHTCHTHFTYTPTPHHLPTLWRLGDAALQRHVHEWRGRPNRHTRRADLVGAEPAGAEPADHGGRPALWGAVAGGPRPRPRVAGAGARGGFRPGPVHEGGEGGGGGGGVAWEGAGCFGCRVLGLDGDCGGWETGWQGWVVGAENGGWIGGWRSRSWSGCWRRG
ncbi:hypothetical protein MMC15_005380 [Xylographa vitiligo]|nr:hypothetical protein [Xylographa vitiligo]